MGPFGESGLSWEQVEQNEARDAANMEVVERYLSEGAAGDYAGSYLVPETGVTWVGFTTGPRDHERRLRSLIAEPESLRVFSARWSFVELERVQDALSDEMDEWVAVDWVGSGLDVVGNRVVCTINSPIPEELTERLARLFGDAVVVERGSIDAA